MAVLGSPALISHIVSVEVKHHERRRYEGRGNWVRAQELCESRIGRPGIPVINTVMFRTVSVDRRDLLIRKVGSSRLYKSHADKRTNLRTGFLFRWPIIRMQTARLLHFAREDFV